MSRMNNSKQGGSSLIELLVAISLFSIVALSLAKSVGFSNRIQSKTNSNSVAMQIALEGLESYAKKDPLTLSAVTNSSSTIAKSPTTYTRLVSITVNSDNSRTVQVTVSDNNKVVKASATVKGTFTSQSSS